MTYLHFANELKDLNMNLNMIRHELNTKGCHNNDY